MKYEVLLTTGTVGTVSSNTEIEEGKYAVVTLQDENGIRISETGIVAEVLNTYEDWE